MSLSTELTKLGVLPHDADVVAKAYELEPEFIEGLECISTALAYTRKPDPKAPAGAPWFEIHTRMMLNDNLDTAFSKVMNKLNGGVANALTGAVSARITHILNTSRTTKIGSKPTRKAAKRITSTLLQSPDPDLVKDLGEALTAAAPDDERKHNAASLLLNWMDDHGRFVRTPQQELFYLYRDDRRLYEIGTERWKAWLYNLTALSPSGRNFGAMDDAAKAAAGIHGDEVEVVRLAHYDKDERTLRVSRFDGTVYMLDGQNITEEANGDGPVLFDDSPMWQPYRPDFSGEAFEPGSCLSWTTQDVPHWDSENGKQTLALRAWTLSVFFSEFCPPKPILVMLGEKGSGKSMALRVLLMSLFGQWGQVAGVPDKPDGFVAAASHSHVYVLDNLDTVVKWMRDKLARVATGGVDNYRKLYSNNELGTVVYRCWLATTARTPDTLRRDDLADRLLILKVKRLEDNERRREGAFLERALEARNAWWGDTLTELSKIVAALRAGSIPIASPLRMADWEALGRIMARGIGKEPTWEKVIQDLKTAQANFLADEEIIIEAITAWLNDPLFNNSGKAVSARDLYNGAQEALWPRGNNTWPMGKPDSSWPKNISWFGRRIKNVTEYLERNLGMEHWTDSRGAWYRFNGVI